MTFPSTLLPQTNNPEETQKGTLDMLDKINKVGGVAPVTGKAADLAKLNPILQPGQVGFETDTLSFKLGLDGKTKYNSLTYVYRGLPAPGEPSVGTPHKRPVLLVSGAPGNDLLQTKLTTVPAGSKWIEGYIQAVATGAASITFYDTDGTTVITPIQINVFGVNEYHLFRVPLDSSLQYRYATVNHGNLTTLNTYLVTYHD